MNFYPTFSVIIPACNEELFITKAITSVKNSISLTNESYEIIVVLNRCTDTTEQIALLEGCKIVKNDAKNLSIIRNAGVAEAKGKIIVTVDADSIVSENMFKEIFHTLSNDKNIGGGTVIIPERFSLGILLTGILLLPTILKERVSGGLFFVRKTDFDAIGGFDESIYSAEDIDFARRLKAFGKETNRKFITLWKTHIITSCRKFDKFGDWYFVKNPMMVHRLLKGKNKHEADLVWYDFHVK